MNAVSPTAKDNDKPDEDAIIGALEHHKHPLDVHLVRLDESAP